ncbi:hypothetical protein V5O48_016836 [Marasmius crinis-equi]|uniref:Major facilitator superfamily (MFS) profile domain-containing protein n=1 Tax=Marasmius crinis-equi TaxID=585013 RepID=A0ABR3EQV9_9AGAR
MSIPLKDREGGLVRQESSSTHSDSTVTTGCDNSSTTTDSTSPFIQTKSQSTIAYAQIVALAWTLFLSGWNDGTIGPLLPKIKAVYHLSDTVVSLVFVFACLGSICGACLNVPLSGRLRFGKVLVLGMMLGLCHTTVGPHFPSGSLLQIIAYALQSTAPPFPVFVMADAINSAGIALLEAQASSFVATLQKRPEAKMGLLHAFFGLGAFLAPIVATQFAQMEGRWGWSFYFLISLGLGVVNGVLLAVVFRFESHDYCLEQIGQLNGQDCSSSLVGSFKEIFSHRDVQRMGCFLFVYVGLEATIPGWMVTFVKRKRHGGAHAGYVASGFFGGLGLGTVALLWLNALVSEHYAVFIYTALAIGLEFIVWFVPSLVGNAVAIFIIGFLLGPIYPITMNHAGRTLPRWMLAGSMGWMSGLGQAGSAIFPLVAGVLAERRGIMTLQPLLVFMMIAMAILWGVNVAGRSSEDQKRAGGSEGVQSSHRGGSNLGRPTRFM